MRSALVTSVCDKNMDTTFKLRMCLIWDWGHEAMTTSLTQITILLFHVTDGTYALIWLTQWSKLPILHKLQSFFCHLLERATTPSDFRTAFMWNLAIYSLSGWTSFRKISWSPEAARLRFRLFQSLWNLVGTSAAVLQRCLSNLRAIW